jgi:hypothetical protein
MLKIVTEWMLLFIEKSLLEVPKGLRTGLDVSAQLLKSFRANIR